MKTTVIYTAAFFILCLTGMKCEKSREQPKEELPAETMEGKRTFGCLINGNVWLFKDKFPYSGLTASIQFEILSLSASNASTGESLGFGIRNMNQAGRYSLTQINNTAIYFLEDEQYDCIEGEMVITNYNRSDKVISGNFRLKAKSERGKIVNIEKGRFDVKYTD